MIKSDLLQGAPLARPIASTAYDTAWVAAIPRPDNRGKPRFPGALDWIAAHQLPDGSWGSVIAYPPDRIISTLAALVALARFGRHGSARSQIECGERYLWQHAHLLHGMPCELVGLELLLPALMRAVAEAGMHVPGYLDAYPAERKRKLELVPPDKIYSPHATIAHSAEFLGSNVNLPALLSMQSANGSIGNSPAATAYLLHQIEDSAAVAYLERCLAIGPDGGVPALEPCETFATLWIAYHRFLGGVSPAALLSGPVRDELLAALAGRGVSLSPSFHVPDADNTAIALLLLHEADVSVAPSALRQFERDEYFVSFPYERHPSTGVNIHVLMALLRFPSYPNRGHAIAKILRFLKAARRHERYWLDKWHISPYYATSHAMVALAELPARYNQDAVSMIDAAAEWIVCTQNADGSWGFYHAATTEETAYALIGLHAARSTARVATAIDVGRRYLGAHLGTARPALWIDKCLYYPPRIVDAVIEAACSRAVANGMLEAPRSYT